MLQNLVNHLPDMIAFGQSCLEVGRVLVTAVPREYLPASIYLGAGIVHGFRARRAEPHHAETEMLHCQIDLAMATAYLAGSASH